MAVRKVSLPEVREINRINQIMKNSTNDSIYYLKDGIFFSVPDSKDARPSYVKMKSDVLTGISAIIKGDELFAFIKDNKTKITNVLKCNETNSLLLMIDDTIAYKLTITDLDMFNKAWSKFVKNHNIGNKTIIQKKQILPTEVLQALLSKNRIKLTDEKFTIILSPKCLIGLDKTCNATYEVYKVTNIVSKCKIDIILKDSAISNYIFFINIKEN